MSVSEDLSRLGDLYSAGMLSYEEFTHAKNQLLQPPPAVVQAPAQPPPPQYSAPVMPGPQAYQQPYAGAHNQPYAGPHTQPYGAAPPLQVSAHDTYLPPYYQLRFARFDAARGGFSATWNWPAFLFGCIWYLVKGMWAKALIIFALMVVTGGILAIPAWIYMGIAGNYDYYLLKRQNKQLW